MAEDYPTVGSMGGDTEARLARLEALWAQAQQMGLDDLLGGNHGAQRYQGNTARTDPTGIQIASSAISRRGVRFVRAYSTTPETFDDHASLLGYADASTGWIQLEAIDNENALTRNAYVQVYEEASADARRITIAFEGTNGGSLVLEAGTGKYSLIINNVPLGLASVTADPTIELSDSFVWYRSDTDKARLRANGATDNFAMEGWVTTNTLAAGLVLGAYKDADQENTGTVLATDSELSVTLAATSKYQIEANLFILNDGATEGYKVAVTGTVGIQDLKAQIEIYDDTLNTIVGFARVTAIDTAVGAGLSSGSNYAAIRATIETTTAGTFAISFAQNAAGASAGVHHEIGCSLQVVKVE